MLIYPIAYLQRHQRHVSACKSIKSIKIYPLLLLLATPLFLTGIDALVQCKLFYLVYYLQRHQRQACLSIRAAYMQGQHALLPLLFTCKGIKSMLVYPFAYMQGHHALLTLLFTCKGIKDMLIYPVANLQWHQRHVSAYLQMYQSHAHLSAALAAGDSSPPDWG